MNRRFQLFSLALAVAAMTACNESGGTSDPVFCELTVSSVLQSGADLVATGVFTGGQPIITLGSTVIAATNYTNSTATFDLTGVTPGTYTVKWSVSCDDSNTTGAVDGSKVKSITIH